MGLFGAGIGYGIGLAYGAVKHERGKRKLKELVKARYEKEGLESAQQLADYIFARSGYRVPVPPE